MNTVVSDPQVKEVLNTGELAEYLGVSESIVRRMVRERKIPFNKIEGRYLFFLPVIREWLKSSTFMPDPEADAISKRRVDEIVNIIWDKAQGEK